MVAAAKLRSAQEAVVQARPYGDEARRGGGSWLASPRHRCVSTSAGARAGPRRRVLADRVDLRSRSMRRLQHQSHPRRREFLRRRARQRTSDPIGAIGRKAHELSSVARSRSSSTFPRRAPHRSSWRRPSSRAPIATLRARRRGRRDLAPFHRFRRRSRRSDIGTVAAASRPADASDDVREYLFEPDRNAVIENLLPRYVEVKVCQAVLESIASEHGARA